MTILKRIYTKEDLLECAHGRLGIARLPLPPLLMLDRVTHIQEHHKNKKIPGGIAAELDIAPDLWFFDSHFENDPLMPGSLIEEGLRQALGFYAGWAYDPTYTGGAIAKGRFRGCGDVCYSNPVLPQHKTIRYFLSVRKVIKKTKMILVIADGIVKVDKDVEICSVKKMIVTLLFDDD